MSSPVDVVRGLLASINSSTEEAIRQYELSGCGVPSLDSQTEPQLPEDITDLKRALRILEGATHQLCATLFPPATTIYTRGMSGNDVACIRVAVIAGIPDILLSHPNGMHIRDIAIKTGIHEEKLIKVMRGLAATHCFREISPDTFVNNPLSLMLSHNNPMSALMHLKTTESNKYAVANLYDTLVDPEYGPSLDAHKSPWAYGTRDILPNATMFDYMRAYPEFHARFQRAMGGIAKVNGAQEVVTQFPWNEFPAGTTVCDVGGGIGMVSIELAKKYPNLNFTVQDLPYTVEQAQQLWKKDCPAAVEGKRIEFIPFDFFKETPAKGQDIYYIRQIIHDWPTEDCITILKNVRAAMKPSSRILIHEFIIPSNTPGEAVDQGVEKAPAPLLPNYGYGSVRTFHQDIHMLILVNAGERTVEQFKAIGAQAGLRFVRVWDLVDTGLIEFEADGI